MKVAVKKIVIKSIAVTAALAMSGGLLAGCGSSSSSNGKQQLTLTFWGGGDDPKTMKKRAAIVEKKIPNVKLKLQWIPKDYDTKIQTMMSGNTAPDIMEVAENVNAYSSRGQLEDLHPYFKKLGVDPVQRFGKAAVEMYSNQGKMYGAPDRVAPNVVYYNKDIFKEAGVEAPSNKWDWDTLRANLKKLTKVENGKTVHWGYAEGDWWAWYMQWIYQNGGRIVSADGKKAEANSPTNVQALQFYDDLMWKDHTMPTPQQLAQNGPDNLFAQGKLAMETTGFWNVGSLKNAKFNWGVAPLWHGKKNGVALFSNSLAMTSQCKNKDLAAKVIVAMTSKDGQKPIGQAGQDIPSNFEAAKDPSFVNAPWNTQHISVEPWIESSKLAFAAPTIPQWNAMTQAFTDGMSQTWTGKQSVKVGLDKVQQKLQHALDQN